MKTTEIKTRYFTEDEIDTIEKIIKNISENKSYIFLGNNTQILSGSINFVITSIAYFINDFKIRNKIDEQPYSIMKKLLIRLIDSECTDIDKLAELFEQYLKELI